MIDNLYFPKYEALATHAPAVPDGHCFRCNNTGKLLAPVESFCNCARASLLRDLLIERFGAPPKIPVLPPTKPAAICSLSDSKLLRLRHTEEEEEVQLG